MFCEDPEGEPGRACCGANQSPQRTPLPLAELVVLGSVILSNSFSMLVGSDGWSDGWSDGYDEKTFENLFEFEHSK